MSHAAKHFDPQLGIDIHTYLIPPSPVPIPLPTPHIGLVFDPFDYIPFIGGSIHINGVKRATAGTGGLAVHIPIFGVWMPQIRMPMGPQIMDDELFMGSMTVVADGDPLSRIGMPVLDCNIVGMIPPFRLKKPKKPHFSMSLPTSVNLAIPNGVNVGGPPMISILGMAFKGAFAGLGALRRSKLGQRAGAAFTNAKRAVFKSLPPGFLKCKVLRAEPVDIRSGSVVVAHEDFALPGRLPLAWPREYRSDNPYHGQCGHGWETPADIRLEIAPDGFVLMHEPGAGAAVFPGLPTAPGMENAVLELVDGARLVWMQRPGGRDELQVHLKGDRLCAFEHPGAKLAPLREPLRLAIQRIADLCGNEWRFERSGAAGGDGGRLLRIVESGTFEIDEAGRRIELAGRYIDVHAPYGRLQKLTLHDPATGLNYPLVSYQYDAEGDLIAVLDPLDAARSFGYDRHHLVRHTDRNGLSFYYTYNAAWQVEHAWGDGGLHDYRFRYDELLRETEVIDSLGHSSLVKFDENRLPLCEIDPLNGVTVFEYDDVGRTTAVVDPVGGRVEFAYDERGNLTLMLDADGAEHRAEYDHASRPIAIIDPLKARLEQQWDVRGLLVRRVDALGAVTLYEYDGHGQLRVQVDAVGARTTLDFDRHGRLRRLTDALGHAILFEHDAPGRLTRREDASGGVTRYTHDAKGRVLTLQLPGGRSVTCEYDAEDRLVRHVDPNGAEERMAYTGLDSLTRHTQANGHSLHYRYDAEERLTGVVNERGEAYELTRDPLGRIVKETDYWGQSTQFQYNAAGHLVSRIDALGRQLRFESDALGRTTKRILPGSGSAPGLEQETFRYDRAGRLCEMRNTVSHVVRRFDPAGQLLREEQNGFVVEHRYNPLGNRVSRTTATGHVVTTERDLLGRAIRIRIDDEEPVTIERDANGRVIAEQLGTHLHRTCRYDEQGRLSAQAVRADHGPLFDTRFEYDLDGNLTRRDDSRWGSDRYRYDPMGRVIEHVNPDGRLAAWQLDPVGDRLKTRIQGGEVRRVVGADVEEPAAWTREGDIDGYHFAYDRAGNLLQRKALREPGQPCLHLVWDANQRLSESFWSGGSRHGQTTHYGYDPVGRRVFKRNPHDTTWFFWDGDVLLGEVSTPNASSPDARAAMLAHNVYDLAGARRRLAQLGALHAQAREYVHWPESHEPLALLEAARAPRDVPPAAAPERTQPIAPTQRAAAVGGLGGLGTTSLGGTSPLPPAPAVAPASAGRLGGGMILGGQSLANSAGPGHAGGPTTKLAHDAVAARPPDRAAPAPGPSDMERSPRTIAYFHNDVNGAPIRLTSAAGDLLWEGRYDTGGQVVQSNGDDGLNAIRMQGQYADAETGLHYNRYRYYDPVSGLYLSEDPLGLAPSTHLHGYGRNTTSWIDPLGLSCTPTSILATQREISLAALRKAAAVDRWLASSDNRLAQAYRRAQQSNPNFASMIRGRVIDRRMNAWFKSKYGDIPGVRIDQQIPGTGSATRPDLYFPSLEGQSVIFDVGGTSKITGIEKYADMADLVIPITH